MYISLLQSPKAPTTKSAWEDNSTDNWDSTWDDGGVGWNEDNGDDDEFEPIESNEGVTTASAYNWDSHEKETGGDDFFSSIPDHDKVRCAPLE